MHNVNSIIGSTAEPAKSLLNWYYRLGYKRVSYGSDVRTNYYSVIYQKKINGKEHPKFIRLVRFHLRKLLILTAKNKNGQFRFPFNYLRK